MKRKFKNFSKVIICLTLCLSMIAPSLTSFAASGSSASSAATSSTGSADAVSDAVPGEASLRGKNIIISLMQVNNTTEQYQSQIAAHNMSYSDSWSEMGVSIVDNYLNDYPLYMLQENTLKRSAVIRTDRASTSSLNVIDQSGYISTYKLRNVYSSEGKSVPDNFKGINVIGNIIKNNSTYYSAFQNKTLDIDTVMSLANANSSKLQEWGNNFIALWADQETVDDKLNDMFTDDDYYGNLLKYLDLLLVINYLCNDTQEDLISRFLEKLNQDGSDDFVTICAIACVRSDTMDGGNALIPLPIYYAFVTRAGLNAYTHFERAGGSTNPVDPADASISYESNPEAYIADLKNKYYSVKSEASSRYTRLWNARNLIWWTGGSSGYKLATSLRPTDMNGNSTGNCGYTFLAYRANVATPASIVATIESTPPDTNPPDTTPPKSALGQFSIEATSDKFDVEPGNNEVSAEFSIDLKLTEQQRQNATSDRGC
jgi:hypothetical protein